MDRMYDAGVEELLTSIVLQAIEDYNFLKKHNTAKAKKPLEGSFSKQEIIGFFRSDWGKSILGVIAPNLKSKNVIRLIRTEEPKKIVAYDKEGNEVAVFRRRKEVVEFLNGKDPSNVLRCLKGERKTAFGYVWKYI